MLDFSCIVPSLGGGGVCKVEEKVDTDGLFTFATSLSHFKCRNILDFVRSVFLKSKVPRGGIKCHL